MENIKALEKAKMDLYHELVEYYTLLNLSKNKGELASLKLLQVFITSDPNKSKR